MLQVYGKHWWSFLLRGILATLFGTVAIVIPGLTLEVLALLLVGFLIADGVLSFTASFRGRHLGRRWGLLLFEGLVGVALGLFTFIWPGVTVLAIVLIIGFWVSITGIFELLAAVKLQDEIEGEWLLGLGGFLSILFSIILFVNPGVGAVAILWMIGIYAVLFGVSLICLGIRLREKRVVVNI